MIRLSAPLYYNGLIHAAGEVIGLYGDAEAEKALVAAGNANWVGALETEGVLEAEVPSTPPGGNAALTEPPAAPTSSGQQPLGEPNATEEPSASTDQITLGRNLPKQ